MQNRAKTNIAQLCIDLPRSSLVQVQLPLKGLHVAQDRRANDSQLIQNHPLSPVPMPKRLQIPSTVKAKILKAYSSGKTPTEIAMSLRDIKLTVEQIANLVYRAGLTRKKAEADEEAKRSAVEVLKKSREDGVQQLEQVLGAIKDGAVADAEILRDGWDLVTDAAGASSLQRAKSLLLNRTLKLYGLDKTDEQGMAGGNTLAFIYGAPCREPNMKPAEPTGRDVDDIDASNEAADDDTETIDIT